MTRLGYQIPNFTYPDTPPDQLFPAIVKQAQAAEEAGFDRVLVMDHFYQLPQLGAPDEPMIECYTLLSALAQHTSTVRLSSLVTGNTYRNPAVLAKQVTALDVVSGGRATLGIGAGWFEMEHDAFGIEFGTFTDRFEKLEEALQIIIPMLRGERPSLDGKRYTVTEAINSPAPISRIPVMIGGGGEKKTLRMVAQYADESNLTGVNDAAGVKHKLDVLDGHCQKIGRDRSEIAVTLLLAANCAPTMEQADEDLRTGLAAKGWGEDMFELAKGVLIHGDPDTVGERLSEVVSGGLDGVVLSAVANGIVPDRLGLLAEVAGKALA